MTARVGDYLDGHMSERQRRRVERHARQCAGCGPLLRDLALILGWLGELRQRPPVRTGRLIARLREEP
jgi:hypothetical protein